MSRQLPNLIFAHAHFASGLASRPKVARVFGVKAVNHIFESVLSSEVSQSSVNMFFTEVTTVKGIRGVTLICDFVRFDLDVRDPYLTENAKRVTLFVLTQTR